MTPLFPPDILRTLRRNGEQAVAAGAHYPVVKIINPYGRAMWLFTDLDPSEPDHLYGLVDLGHGTPRLGWVSREGLETCYIWYGPARHPMERDPHFTARHTLSVYARAARAARRITESPDDLDRAAAAIALEQEGPASVPSAGPAKRGPRPKTGAPS